MIAGARKSGISRSAKRSSVQIETRAANSIFKCILNLSNKLYVAVYRKETCVPDTFGYEIARSCTFSNASCKYCDNTVKKHTVILKYYHVRFHESIDV